MTSTALDLSASVGISFSMSRPSFDSSGSLSRGGEEEGEECSEEGEEEGEKDEKGRERERRKG